MKRGGRPWGEGENGIWGFGFGSGTSNRTWTRTLEWAKLEGRFGIGIEILRGMMNERNENGST